MPGHSRKRHLAQTYHGYLHHWSMLATCWSICVLISLSLIIDTLTPCHQLKILRPTGFWPSVSVGHFAFSLSHLEGLLRSASPLCNFCVPLKDTQETSICSPVPIWNYRELGATAIDPLCLETVHSSFSSVAALLGFCFSDFIWAVKAHILMLSDPQPLRSFLHLPYSRVWPGLGGRRSSQRPTCFSHFY